MRPCSYLMTISSYHLSLFSRFCALKMESVHSLETFVNSYQNEQHHFPGDSSFFCVVTVLYKDSRRFGVLFLDGARNLSFLLRRLDKIWIPPRPLCGGYRGSSPSQNGCCVKSTAALYQVSSLRMHGDIHPISHFFFLKSWCLVKIKDKLLYTLDLTRKSIFVKWALRKRSSRSWNAVGHRFMTRLLEPIFKLHIAAGRKIC